MELRSGLGLSLSKVDLTLRVKVNSPITGPIYLNRFPASGKPRCLPLPQVLSSLICLLPSPFPRVHKPSPDLSLIFSFLYPVSPPPVSIFTPDIMPNPTEPTSAQTSILISRTEQVRFNTTYRGLHRNPQRKHQSNEYKSKPSHHPALAAQIHRSQFNAHRVHTWILRRPSLTRLRVVRSVSRVRVRVRQYWRNHMNRRRSPCVRKESSNIAVWPARGHTLSSLDDFDLALHKARVGRAERTPAGHH